MLNSNDFKKNGHSDLLQNLACKITCYLYTCGGYMLTLCLTLNDLATHHVCSVLPSLMNYNSLLEMEVDSDTCDW